LQENSICTKKYWYSIKWAGGDLNPEQVET
jgi:hypothetical protein